MPEALEIIIQLSATLSNLVATSNCCHPQGPEQGWRERPSVTAPCNRGMETHRWAGLCPASGRGDAQVSSAVVPGYSSCWCLCSFHTFGLNKRSVEHISCVCSWVLLGFHTGDEPKAKLAQCTQCFWGLERILLWNTADMLSMSQMQFLWES